MRRLLHQELMRGSKAQRLALILLMGLLLGSLFSVALEPFVPADTTAALETTPPLNELSVETKGCGEPVGHIVR